MRAVYNGYPRDADDVKGKVFSFEFNESRYEKMQVEIGHHGLDDLVKLTHRDVYNEGFNVNGESPNATAVFLDLPAPWEALHHLSRRKLQKGGEEAEEDSNWVSPLDPKQSVHICTFSPCIEQVTRTVTELRTLGWVDVDMVEISNQKINISREKVGVNYPTEKGYNSSPADVLEAVTKLKSLAERNKDTQRVQALQTGAEGPDSEMDLDSTPNRENQPSNSNGAIDDMEKPWMQGRLVHRPESELKTHTSYLVFAILPCEWDEEAEAAAMAKWPCGNEKKTIGNLDKQARKEEKRKMLEGKSKKQKKGSDTQTTQVVVSAVATPTTDTA